jgi:hypothetical protein
VQNPLPIYVAGHTQATFRTAARHGAITINRFAHITDSREEGMRFAENARYQDPARVESPAPAGSHAGHRAGVDVPFPDEPPLETIHDNLLIGDVDTGRREGCASRRLGGADPRAPRERRTVDGRP